MIPKMNTVDLVSIITPCFNCSKFIEQTVKSVQGQTYENWELLITDDCSTDNSVEIIKSLAATDKRIRLFKLSQNSGAGAARNNSINEAQGRYIAFLDSDDMWSADKLEKQLKFLKDNNFKFVHSYAKVIDESNNIVGYNTKPYKVTFNSTKIINYIGTSSVIYDTEGIGKFYMPIIRKRQDWGLWLTILSVVKEAYCYPEPLFMYRYTPNSISANKLTLFKYHVDIYKQILGYSSLKANLFFYFVSLPCFVIKKMKEKYRETFNKQNHL